MGYIGMCSPKGYGFSAVLVINRVSIIGGGRKGLRYCGFALFLVRFCGNFHFKLQYFGFPLRGGLRFV